jgi:CMP-N,N'-diacetyllegionaminic acid synthase
VNILAITLARGGSKGIPRKNIKKLAGEPLIDYTIRPALNCDLITDYVVSTDDAEIAEHASKRGALVPFLRPSIYSADDSSSLSALQHCVKFMEKFKNIKYDYIIELMATNPLKNLNDIRTCITMLVDTQADSVIAVHRLLDNHPARIKKIEGGLIKNFCIPEPNEARRQDLEPHAYIRSGSIYALRRDYLMVEGQRYGSDNSIPYILPNERVANIDEIDDWMLAEMKILRNREENL